MKRKQQHHEAIRERARRALVDLYHNATPRYPSLEGDDAERFQSWFEDAAMFEIEYLRDGGAYGKNYRKTLAAPCNAGKYATERARDYYIAKGMRAMRDEREDCGMFTGWRALELAAGNAALAKVLRPHFKGREMRRNDSRWECIGDYGKLYQYGRGGRTLAPDDLIRMRGGSSFSINEDAGNDWSIADVVRLIRVLESFNRVVGEWCHSVPEQWEELERERRAEERAERKRAREQERQQQAVRDRCNTYPG